MAGINLDLVDQDEKAKCTGNATMADVAEHRDVQHGSCSVLQQAVHEAWHWHQAYRTQNIACLAAINVAPRGQHSN